MHPIDLFELVKNNTNSISQEYSELVQECPGLQDVVKAVEEQARITVNRHVEPLMDLLKKNKLVSGYEHASNTGFNEDSFEQYLLATWSKYTPKYFIKRRVAFLKTFKDGDKHIFGALNGGGPGAAAKNAAYGYYCIVFKNESFHSDNVAYCKYDTLVKDEYWTCDKYTGDCENCSAKKNRPSEQKPSDFYCEVNKQALLPAYASHNQRGHLVAIKHYPNICNDSSWEIANIIQQQVNQTEEYIEACFVLSEITKDCIEEIRLHEEIVMAIFKESCMEEHDINNKFSTFIKHQEVLKLLEQLNITVNLPSCI